MAEFYGNKTEAAEQIAKVELTAVEDFMLVAINDWIDSNIRLDGFDVNDRIEYHTIEKNCDNELLLEKSPITSEDNLIITDNVNRDPIIVNNECYYVDKESGIIQILPDKAALSSSQNIITHFSKGINSVKVEYKFGFLDVPSLIQSIATLMLAKWLKIRDQNLDADGMEIGNLKSVHIGNYSESHDLGFMNIKSEYDMTLNGMIERAKKIYFEV